MLVLADPGAHLPPAKHLGVQDCMAVRQWSMVNDCASKGCSKGYLGQGPPCTQRFRLLLFARVAAASPGFSDGHMSGPPSEIRYRNQE